MRAERAPDLVDYSHPQGNPVRAGCDLEDCGRTRGAFARPDLLAAARRHLAYACGADPDPGPDKQIVHTGPTVPPATGAGS